MNGIPIPVKSRGEMEIVPYGVSCTETEQAYYLRIRNAHKYICIRVLVDSLAVTSITEEIRDE